MRMTDPSPEHVAAAEQETIERLSAERDRLRGQLSQFSAYADGPFDSFPARPKTLADRLYPNGKK